MTTPTTGQQREEQAQQAGAAVGAALQAAEGAIIASIAAAVARVLAGSLIPAMARRTLARSIASSLGAAMQQVNPVIGRLPAAVQQQVRQAVLTAQQSAIEAGDRALAAASGTAGNDPGRSGTAGNGGGRSRTPPGAPGQPGGKNASELYQLQMDEAKREKGGPFRPDPDAYRNAVRDAMQVKMSRLKQAQKVMDDLASQGITGFTDKAGRNWSLSSYAEMATRTASSRLTLQQQLHRMGPAGVTLVLVDEPAMEAPCPLCLPWSGRVVSLVPFTAGSSSTITDASGVRRTEQIAGTLAEAVAAGLLHPNCFPGDVLVSAPSGVRAADSRWYEGELVVIHTAGGDELPVTPNHPVLTPEGWVAAGSLKVGQYVLRYGTQNELMSPALAGMRPDEQLIPARIGDVFDALRQSSGVPAVRVPASAEQFHGDGHNSDVEVVLADGFLKDHRNAERIGYRALLSGSPGQGGLAPSGPRFQFGLGSLYASYGIMGGGGQLAPLCRAHAGGTAPVGFAAGDLGASLADELAEARLLDAEAGGDGGLRFPGLVAPDGLGDLRGGQSAFADGARLLDVAEGAARADAELLRDLIDSLAGPVTVDEISDLGRRQVATHVYNLQAGDGWYVANGIVVHNCRHSLLPWHDGTGLAATVGGAQRGYVVGGQPVSRSLPIGSPADYKAEQKLRAHERNVRAAAMGVSAALTPQAKRKARADLHGARTALEAHVAESGATRLPGREKPFRSDRAAHPGQPYRAR